MQPVQKYVNIGTTDNKLTGFQRRLVHQIVRRDFPNLRTYNRCDGDFMQIEKLNVEQEAIVSPLKRLRKCSSMC